MSEPDHIDLFLERSAAALERLGIEREVEGIVDRIGGINKRIKRAMEETLGEHGLTYQEWQVLTTLVWSEPDHRSSPGALASHLELSSGAMTSRLDGLEASGLLRRLPDPDDRRAVVVELTAAGRSAWDTAAVVQARREAFFASALSKPEQRRLNDLLRKLLLALESRERR
jgi:DNA-binding MarR family transcriptional regulator